MTREARVPDRLLRPSLRLRPGGPRGGRAARPLTRRAPAPRGGLLARLPPEPPRSSDRPAESARLRVATRKRRPRRRRGRGTSWRCACSTSTASRRSTTASATSPATRCCARSPVDSPAAGSTTRPSGSAATSSPSSSRCDEAAARTAIRRMVDELDLADLTRAGSPSACRSASPPASATRRPSMPPPTPS